MTLFIPASTLEFIISILVVQKPEVKTWYLSKMVPAHSTLPSGFCKATIMGYLFKGVTFTPSTILLSERATSSSLNKVGNVITIIYSSENYKTLPKRADCLLLIIPAMKLSPKNIAILSVRARLEMLMSPVGISMARQFLKYSSKYTDSLTMKYIDVSF